MHVFLIHLLFARFFNMADDGEEFVVDKILDKRVRNGKVVYKLLPFFHCFIKFDFRLSTTFPGRVLGQRRTHGSRERTWIAPN